MTAIRFESGIVRRVLSDRGFGFISRDNAAPGEKDVFFLLSDGCDIVVAGNGKGLAPAPYGHGCVAAPVAGQRVVFVLCQTPRGLKARPWAHYVDYVAAQDCIAATPTYRLVQIKQFVGKVVTGDPVESVVWEGSNIDDLFRLYPISNDLAPHTRRGFKITHQFLRHHDGEWVNAEDPRFAPGSQQQQSCAA